ncbi:hypothetical protein DIURU_004911 [Diutina rugosa]|uniref:Zn(2)-C6 fungal-type domain-containing protein n=1 Tax=Diutina rugosa TaxID=5481 RepID=A0A642UHW9_DIURU|nr:uncharacterized protein DIURU_004911 [Diutina rugosa]KAA8898057.1 hypothetical protein DIURU_004911 [Diutina rugosa]
MYDDHPSHIKKKRVGKACDSCRIKKTKCDGKKPCGRCIADNKICVFTEKKKLREKSHPQGYVELLETRLDILTKSLEKMVELSTPHLAFLQKLAVASPEDDLESASDDDGEGEGNENAIPINRVVEYLINQEGLLKNLPVEWEKGASIAASFDPKRNLRESAKQFADHKGDVADPQPATSSSGSSGRAKRREDSSLASSSTPLGSGFGPTQFSIGSYSPGGLVLASSAPVNCAEPQGLSPSVFSDVDSDNNSLHSGLNQTDVSPPIEVFHKRSNSLFLDNFGVPPEIPLPKQSSHSSVSSLQSPSMIAAEAAAVVTAPLDRRGSVGRSGPYSPKLGPQNGVHKPSHLSATGHHRSASLISDYSPPTEMPSVFQPQSQAYVAPDMIVNSKDMMDVEVADLQNTSGLPASGSSGLSNVLNLSMDDDLGWTNPFATNH